MPLEEIKDVISKIDCLPLIEAGFVAYSQGRAVIPAPGELVFSDPPGDVCIKYGYLKGGDYYVVKIASGFYNNPQLFNLPSSNGLMLLFSQKTGELSAILLDQGYLTDLRTALAGAISAKYLAPKNIKAIGIIGSGTQARLQLQYLSSVIDCKNVLVWTRNIDNFPAFQTDMQQYGFTINSAKSVKELAANCNLIVTTTPTTSPILLADYIQAGTHITAVGADSPTKQELDSAILAKADKVVADSIEQCIKRGEIAHAIREHNIKPKKLIELGQIISDTQPGRNHDNEITVADLTGLAVQDLQIAQAVLTA